MSRKLWNYKRCWESLTWQTAIACSQYLYSLRKVLWLDESRLDVVITAWWKLLFQSVGQHCACLWCGDHNNKFSTILCLRLHDYLFNYFHHVTWFLDVYDVYKQPIHVLLFTSPSNQVMGIVNELSKIWSETKKQTKLILIRSNVLFDMTCPSW